VNPVVALDIETTGLDPHRDAIIEIGAVFFDGENEVKRWQSLINPQRLIPKLITQLTGITNKMVQDAPHIEEVIQEFSEFVGGFPLINRGCPAANCPALQPERAGIAVENRKSESPSGAGRCGSDSVCFPEIVRYREGSAGSNHRGDRPGR
jgi:hypothetical protein